MPSPRSADTTPTSVTRGKSCPLAIICVPTSRSSSPRPNRASTSWIAPRFCIVSRSTRPARMPGNRRSTSVSTRSVPKPSCSRYGAAHFTHVRRHAHRVVAVVAQRARRPVGSPMHGERHAAVRTLQDVPALAAQHAGGVAATIEQQQRLLPGRQSRSHCLRQGRAEHDIRALRPHTPPGDRRCGRWRAGDRARAARAPRADSALPPR